jgi:hypothetical protein
LNGIFVKELIIMFKIINFAVIHHKIKFGFNLIIDMVFFLNSILCGAILILKSLKPIDNKNFRNNLLLLNF